MYKGPAASVVAMLVILLLVQTAGLWLSSHSALRDGMPLPTPHQPSSMSASQLSMTGNTLDWVYKPEAHADDPALTPSQCDAAFPKLWYEIDRSIAFRKEKLAQRITTNDTSLYWRRDGAFRALIHNNQLRILETKGIFSLKNSQYPERTIAVWQQIHRALLGAAAAGEKLPSIEFAATVDDIPGDIGSNDLDTRTLWAFCRKYSDRSHDRLFLMPDFNHWSWHGVAGPLNEMQAYSKIRNESMESKIPKAAWRGATWTNPRIREPLIKATSQQPWADVANFDWSTRHGFISMEDFCLFAFLIHTEGRSWSGRLKYLLGCESVTLIHDLDWTTHYYHLLVAEGPGQNFVSVKDDFSNLREKVMYFLENIEEAQRIADNAVETFRDRYLTLGAETCYWRKLIKGWSTVADSPQVYETVHFNISGFSGTKEKLRGIAFEELVVSRATREWPPEPSK